MKKFVILLISFVSLLFISCDTSAQVCMYDYYDSRDNCEIVIINSLPYRRVYNGTCWVNILVRDEHRCYIRRHYRRPYYYRPNYYRHYDARGYRYHNNGQRYGNTNGGRLGRGTSGYNGRTRR